MKEEVQKKESIRSNIISGLRKLSLPICKFFVEVFIIMVIWNDVIVTNFVSGDFILSAIDYVDSLLLVVGYRLLNSKVNINF